MIRALLASCLMLAACGNPYEPAGYTEAPAGPHREIYIHDALTEHESAALQMALDEWATVTSFTYTMHPGEPSPGYLMAGEVVIYRSPADHLPGSDDTETIIGMTDWREGGFTITIAGGWTQNETAVAHTFAHEIGHTFGLVHVTDRKSVMAPQYHDANETDEPCQGDIDAYKAIFP